VIVAGLSGATQVSAGFSHSCALLSSGAVQCWGRNDYGELGDGTMTARGTPAAVVGLADAVAVSAGADHTCAVRRDGQAFCWGSNVFGELGDGTNTDRSMPTPVVRLPDATAISAGLPNTCAVRLRGDALCWGLNSDGELGNGTTTSSSAPVAVAGLTAVDVLATAGSPCAVYNHGLVACWGFGAGAGTSPQTVPLAVPGLADATRLAVGFNHRCVVRTGGALQCWGQNREGALGDGTFVDRSAPVPALPLGGEVVSVAAGDGFTCVVLAGGQLLCWGRNDVGELGNGRSGVEITPVQVVGTP
jgi:alpha-tubulin suppressor-like RCC1 family protein